ncbi:MAG: type II toxin-antitoxin system RelE/ParE family toxin [Bacteroidales bacterium]|nr:type II toxin-antitoxin system RelE/ParE family toxin [Bacteroidales bacterium]
MFVSDERVYTYKRYFLDFYEAQDDDVKEKIDYALMLLKTQSRISTKFVKQIEEGIFELRAEYKSNIYRIFFIFDSGNIVVLFNGFQKKTQKTPRAEIEKAKRIKKEYYESKQ